MHFWYVLSFFSPPASLSPIFMRVDLYADVTVQVVTYDQCVQEVMLRRATGDQDYKERLAHFVVTRYKRTQRRII